MRLCLLVGVCVLWWFFTAYSFRKSICRSWCEFKMFKMKWCIYQWATIKINPKKYDMFRIHFTFCVHNVVVVFFFIILPSYAKRCFPCVSHTNKRAHIPPKQQKSYTTRFFFIYSDTCDSSSSSKNEDLNICTFHVQLCWYTFVSVHYFCADLLLFHFGLVYSSHPTTSTSNEKKTYQS